MMSDPAAITQQPQTGGSNRSTKAASRILELPAELRLMICSYMTLSPADADSVAWKGAYFTCREIHEDMRKQLKPEREFENCIENISSSVNHFDHNLRIMIGLEHPPLHLIREVTVHLPIQHLYIWRCCHMCLKQLYALYLDRINILLTGHQSDIAGWNRSNKYQLALFMTFVRTGRINCKNVTFTNDTLANKEGGREKSKTFVLTDRSGKSTCLMKIVQDRVGVRTEWVYLNEHRVSLPGKDLRAPRVRCDIEELDVMLCF